MMTVAPALAADVEISSDIHNGYLLDGHSGSTVQVDNGVTLDNTTFNFICPSGTIPGGYTSSALCASTSAWSVTNNGTIGQGGIYFIAGGNVDNYGSISSDNAIWIERGYATVVNEKGATTTGALVIGNFDSLAQATGGSVENWGTMTSGGQTVGVAGSGIVTNHKDALIQGANGGTAVTFVIGTSHVVVNDGTIQSNDGSGGTGVAADYGDITNSSTGQILGAYNGIWANGSGATTIKNDGLIEASKAIKLYGLFGSAIEMDAGGSITNSGTIRAFTSSTTNGDYGIYFSGAGSITNTGTIESTDGGMAIKFNGNKEHTLTLGTGSVLVGAVQGGSGTDHLILQGTGSETLDQFAGFETLDMQGTHWTLTNSGTIATSTSVSDGILSVNGTLTTPALTIANGGTLGGGGTVAGAVEVSAGGKIAPGNSIGTLTVAAATYDANSTFEVQVDPTSADELVVTATATIDPSATVSVLAGSGTYSDGHSYLILNAGTRNGTFGGITDDSAFLSFSLDQTHANQVWLTVTKIVNLPDVAETPNQFAAATGIQGQGSGTPLFDAIAMLDADSARAAFDLSSGEIHATTGGALLDDSRFVREAVLDRLDQDWLTSGALGGGGADGVAAGPTWSAWGQGVGSSANANGDGNAASYSRSLGGFFAGMDARSPGAWALGGAIGYTGTSLSVPDRLSAATITGYHAAVYGQIEVGNLALRLGGAAMSGTISTVREDTFAGFSETLSASYGATVGQAFAEAAYRMHFGGVTFEPYADIAAVNASTGAFSETGGAAALSASAQSHGITFTTIGARASTLIPLGGSAIELSASIGWQHAIGDTTPMAALAFAGGTPFTVAGVPMARDALKLDARADWRIGSHTSLGIGYSGLIASGAGDHAVTARLTIRF